MIYLITLLFVLFSFGFMAFFGYKLGTEAEEERSEKENQHPEEDQEEGEDSDDNFIPDE